MEALILLAALTANPYDHMATVPRKIPAKSAILARYDFLREDKPEAPQNQSQQQQNAIGAARSESKGLFRGEGLFRRLFSRERRGLFRGRLRGLFGCG